MNVKSPMTPGPAYLWYLLRYRVAELQDRRPGPEDLHPLAERVYPAFARLTRGDVRQLENTLLTVFGFASEDRRVIGGIGVVMGSAALGSCWKTRSPGWPRCGPTWPIGGG